MSSNPARDTKIQHLTSTLSLPSHNLTITHTRQDAGSVRQSHREREWGKELKAQRVSPLFGLFLKHGGTVPGKKASSRNPQSLFLQWLLTAVHISCTGQWNLVVWNFVWTIRIQTHNLKSWSQACYPQNQQPLRPNSSVASAALGAPKGVSAVPVPSNHRPLQYSPSPKTGHFFECNVCCQGPLSTSMSITAATVLGWQS